MATPTDIVLSQLSTPPVKGLVSPYISSKPDYRDGSRPADGPDVTPPPTGEIIWKSDFDNSADWTVQHTNQRYHYAGDTSQDGSSGFVGQNNIPPGFDWYYTAERWHPAGGKDGSGAVANSHPVAQINGSLASRRPGGKALVIYDESYGTSSQWGADANLTKDFAEAPEIYLETYIRFQDGYVFQDWPEFFGNGVALIKLFRVGRFFGSDDDPVHTRFSSSSQAEGPLAMYQLGSYTAQSGTQYTQITMAARGNPYFKIDDFNHVLQGPSISERLLDGQWHQVGLYLKMNSAHDVADGVYEMYLDGEIPLRTDGNPAASYSMLWNPVEADEGLGWNMLHFGGNANNRPYDEAEQYEQWLAYDDVCIYNGKPEAA